jgi:hypothetical protein
MTSRKPNGAAFVLGLLTGAVTLSLALLLPPLARAWRAGDPAPWRGVLLGVDLLAVTLAVAALPAGFRELSRSLPRRPKAGLDARAGRAAGLASTEEPIPRHVGLSP